MSAILDNVFRGSRFTAVSICLLVIGLQTCGGQHDADEIPTIAIIGAGIGGTSAAYFARETFGPDVEIDVFESNTVGGRLATVTVQGQEYESGGSMIHPENMYMVNFTKLFNLEKRASSSSRLGIYDGLEMLFAGSEWSWVNIAQLVWRYGMNIYNINTWVGDWLKKFVRIYEHQSNGIAFTTVEELLLSMDNSLVEYSQMSLKSVLQDAGFSERFIDELVQAAMMGNYGQSVDLHGFVGAVSLAGAQPGLWAVEGGNKKVPENLLKNAKVKFRQATVTMIQLMKTGDSVSYNVEYVTRPEGDKKSKTSLSEYDIIILAAPMQKGVSEIKFEDFLTPMQSPVPYHRLISNFVYGQPNSTFFGYKEEKAMPNAIMLNKPGYFINTYAQNFPVKSNVKNTEKNNEDINSVWKMFSNQDLSDSDLNKLYIARQEFNVVDWVGAYPEYSGKAELPSFVLYDQLYYINAIEQAAAAMEMSAIAAKNVVLLAYNHWNGLFHKINEIETQSETKSEL